MVSVHSDQRDAAALAPQAVKILVAGGFGVGKTTMVASVSEIPPLSTEELLTEASTGVDDARMLLSMLGRDAPVVAEARGELVAVRRPAAKGSRKRRAA